MTTKMAMKKLKPTTSRKFGQSSSVQSTSGAGSVGKDGIVFDTDSPQLQALGNSPSTKKKRGKILSPGGG